MNRNLVVMPNLLPKTSHKTNYCFGFCFSCPVGDTSPDYNYLIYLLVILGYLEEHDWTTHLVSKGEHLPFQGAMLLSCLLQLSLLTRQLLLQAQEFLHDKHRHTFIVKTEFKHEEEFDSNFVTESEG